MTAAKLSFLLGLAFSAAFVAEGSSIQGWLYDTKCIEKCRDTTGPASCTPDGSNSFYTPSKHTGQCLLLPECVLSGYNIISEYPGEDGRHSVVLKLVGSANTTAYELVKNSGTSNSFPMVHVTFDETNLVSTDTDGVPIISAVTGMTTVDILPDPWAVDPDKYYSGAPTTQVVCKKSSDGEIETNNMCFRSDVEVSTATEDGTTMLVIETNGCPDHRNMMGESHGSLKDENVFPCDDYDFISWCQSGGCSATTKATCSPKCCSNSPSTCSSTNATCSAKEGCSSTTKATCSPKACGTSSSVCSATNATCSAKEGCSSTTKATCSPKACGTSSSVCSATNATCSAKEGCSSTTKATCSPKACGTSSSVCSATNATCSPKCCSASSCSLHYGKYAPFFQHYTLKIPKNPGAPEDKPQLLKDDDVVGIMFNGVIVGSHKQTWAYDVCNGHSDEKRQYHYHIPQSCYLESLGVAFAASSNYWINDEGDGVREYGDMAAQFPATGPPSPVVGMALDGYPIYGLYDEEGNLQRSKAFNGSLDECNGKKDSDGNYGYYLAANPPFAPACLKGSKIGTFTYVTYDKACPKEGIKNSIKFATDGQLEGVGGSHATMNIPCISALVAMVAVVSSGLFLYL